MAITLNFQVCGMRATSGRSWVPLWCFCLGVHQLEDDSHRNPEIYGTLEEAANVEQSSRFKEKLTGLDVDAGSLESDENGGQVAESSGSLRRFEFRQLKKATSGFLEPDMVLGRGGFGVVYKGWLKSPESGKLQPVAVKRLDPEGGFQGEQEWTTEIEKLGKLKQEYIIQLIGYCSHPREALLVYEYMPNGSLDYHLFRSSYRKEYEKDVQPISWRNRLKIARHAACALAYLHSRRVVHRDVKTSNILLDKEYNAKLTDFGLARESVGDKTHVTATRILGSLGYLDPNYYETGKLSWRTDIFAFGVILFEIFTGRRATELNDRGHGLFWAWAKDAVGGADCTLLSLVDPCLVQEVNTANGLRRALALLRTALACVDGNLKRRPTARELQSFFEDL